MMIYTFESKKQLFDKYLPYIEGGGLKINNQKYSIGDTIDITVILREHKEEYSLTAKVVAKFSHAFALDCEAGVQFLNKSGYNLNKRIENYLIGMLESN